MASASFSIEDEAKRLPDCPVIQDACKHYKAISSPGARQPSLPVKRQQQEEKDKLDSAMKVVLQHISRAELAQLPLDLYLRRFGAYQEDLKQHKMFDRAGVAEKATKDLQTAIERITKEIGGGKPSRTLSEKQQPARSAKIILFLDCQIRYATAMDAIRLSLKQAEAAKQLQEHQALLAKVPTPPPASRPLPPPVMAPASSASGAAPSQPPPDVADEESPPDSSDSESSADPPVRREPLRLQTQQEQQPLQQQQEQQMRNRSPSYSPTRPEHAVASPSGSIHSPRFGDVHSDDERQEDQPMPPSSLRPITPMPADPKSFLSEEEEPSAGASSARPSRKVPSDDEVLVSHTQKKKPDSESSGSEFLRATEPGGSVAKKGAPAAKQPRKRKRSPKAKAKKRADSSSDEEEEEKKVTARRKTPRRKAAPSHVQSEDEESSTEEVPNEQEEGDNMQVDPLGELTDAELTTLYAAGQTSNRLMEVFKLVSEGFTVNAEVFGDFVTGVTAFFAQTREADQGKPRTAHEFAERAAYISIMMQQYPHGMAVEQEGEGGE